MRMRDEQSMMERSKPNEEKQRSSKKKGKDGDDMHKGSRKKQLGKERSFARGGGVDKVSANQSIQGGQVM